MDELADPNRRLSCCISDIESQTSHLIGEGDWVASLGIFRGTQTGDCMGIPATNKPAEFTWIHFFRVNDGKIVELHVEQDTLTMMQQLGVIPVPGQ